MNKLVVTDIMLVHWFYSPPSWSSDEYLISRKHHGIVYVLSGHADYHFRNGTVMRVSAGDAVYLPAVSSYMIDCGPEEAFIHMTVNFDLSGGQSLFPTTQVFSMKDQPLFEKTMTTLVGKWDDQAWSECMGCLYQLIAMLQNQASSAPSRYVAMVQPAFQYLCEHYLEDFPMCDLAQKCELSENYFRRIFKRVYGMAPEVYKRKKRIALACDLLLSGHLSVTEVASQCGYDDANYFSRVFRETLGISPKGYVQEHLELNKQEEPCASIPIP